MRKNMYLKYLKRPFDVFCSLISICILMPVFIAVAMLVRVKLGSPVIFKQKRPGIKGDSGREKMFTLYKFRSMTNEKDDNGKLISDEKRMTKFGELLRKTSLDELPELWNIIKGDMSIVGPRPLLPRDIIFMTERQRERHNVRPGLSGWAQVNGRNCIDWEDKLDYDLEYVKNISFEKDICIIMITLKKVIKTESITYENMATAEDYGDYLLRNGKISECEYREKHIQADDM